MGKTPITLQKSYFMYLQSPIGARKTIKNRKALLVVLSHCFLFNVLNGQNSLSKGLAAWYPFTANAKDSSGNGNHSTFNNATLTADRFGNPNSAYLFNGNSSYIQVPNSPKLQFGKYASVSLWAKPMAFYTGTCHANYMICKGYEASGAIDALFSDALYNANHGINGCATPVDTTNQTFFSSLGGYSDPSLLPLRTNSWYHIVEVSDSIGTKIYVNGMLLSVNGLATMPYTTPYDLFFGRYVNINVTPYWYNGVLDDIRIYNRGLTNAEVDSLFNEPNPIKQPLPIYLRYFTAIPIGDDKVQIDFALDKELNPQSVTIEKSYDGTDIIEAGVIATSIGPNNNFRFLDKVGTNKEKVHYRLKIVGRDGKNTLSEWIAISLAQKPQISVEVFPNPVTTQLHLSLNSLKEVSIQLKWVNLEGKTITTQNVFAKKGRTSLSVPVPVGIKNGTYTIVLIGDKDVIVKKVVKTS